MAIMVTARIREKLGTMWEDKSKGGITGINYGVSPRDRKCHHCERAIPKGTKFFEVGRGGSSRLFSYMNICFNCMREYIVPLLLAESPVERMEDVEVRTEPTSEVEVEG